MSEKKKIYFRASFFKNSPNWPFLAFLMKFCPKCKRVARYTRNVVKWDFSAIFKHPIRLVYLQAFFWMNVLCYDIFRAFRKIRLTSVASKERDDIRKLLFYTMYASGAPMIIIILSVVVEYQPQTYAGPRPQFGVERCFFGSDVGSFIFFHLPLMIIQVSTYYVTKKRIIFCSVILGKVHFTEKLQSLQKS